MHQQQRPLEAGAQEAPRPEPPPWAWHGPVMDFLIICLRWKLLIAFFFTVAIGLALVVVAAATPLYTATATAVVLPKTGAAINARVSTQRVMIAEENSREGPEFTIPSRPELFSEILQTRQVRRLVAQKLELLDEEGQSKWPIKDWTKISTTEEGLLTVEVRHPDAQTTADLANELIDQTVVAAREIEKQMLSEQVRWLKQASDKAQTALTARETALREFRIETGTIDTQQEGPAAISFNRQMNINLAGKKQKLVALLEKRTEADPEVRTLRKEIDSLTETLRQQGGLQPDGELYAERAERMGRLKQQVTQARDLADVVAMQLRMFELRLSSPPSGIAVLQRAVPPKISAIPNLKRTLFGAIGGGAVLSFGLALAIETILKLRREPTVLAKMGIVRRNLFSLLPKT